MKRNGARDTGVRKGIIEKVSKRCELFRLNRTSYLSNRQPYRSKLGISQKTIVFASSGTAFHSSQEQEVCRATLSFHPTPHHHQKALSDHRYLSTHQQHLA